MAAGSSKMSNLGTKVMLVGLVAQTLSFVFFTVILLVFGIRVCVHPPRTLSSFSSSRADEEPCARAATATTCTSCGRLNRGGRPASTLSRRRRSVTGASFTGSSSSTACASSFGASSARSSRPKGASTVCAQASS